MESVKSLGEKYFRARASKNGVEPGRLERPIAEPPAPKCAKCGDLGFFVPNVKPEDPGFGRSLPCSCQEAVIQGAYWKLSGLEPEEQGWEIDYIKGMAGKIEALASVKMAVGSGVGWVVLHGKYGVGKSGLLKAATASTIRAGRRAFYRRADDILLEAKATFSSSPEKEESDYKILEKYAAVDFLAIDELDRWNVKSDWAQTFLFNLMDRRYNRRGQALTVMATNADIGTLQEPFGYLQSRMREGAVIGVEGENLREVK